MSTTAHLLGEALIRASWQGSIFIAGVWVVCRLAPRIPASSRYWLWWLACAQLPIRLALAPISLPVLPAKHSSPVVLTEASEVAGPAEMASTAIANVDSSAPIPSDPVRPEDVLLIGWGAGAASVLVLAARRLNRTRLMIRSCEPLPPDAETVGMCLAEDLNVRRVTFAESALAPCPLLVGWLHPKVMLPRGFASSRPTSEVEMALAHELVHVKRQDLRMSSALLVTQSLFFFHPLAWLAVRETAAACEEACDTEAMRLTGGSPAAYARLLLSAVQAEAPIAALGAALGFQQLKRRISMLSKSTTVIPVRIRRGVTGLIALASVCSLPWVVTAQSVALPASKPATAATKKPATKHHTRKRSSNRKVAKVAKPTAKTIGIAVAGGPKPTIALPMTSVAATGTGLPGSAATVPAPSLALPVRNGTVSMAPAAAAGTGVALPVRNDPTAVVTGSAGPSVPSAIIATPSTSLPAATVGVRPPAPGEEANFSHATRGSDGTVSIEAHHMSIVSALRHLLKTARVNYVIRSTVVDNDYITCELTNVSVEDALRTMLDSAKQPLTYRIEGGVFIVMPQNAVKAGN